MPFGLFFGLISAFIPSETKSLGEQTHLKSLLGPDFLHLLSLILPSSVYVYLWHQLTKTNPPPQPAELGVWRERGEKKFSSFLCSASLEARRSEEEERGREEAGVFVSHRVFR